MAAAFLAMIDSHREHVWEQVGPCVYCQTCKVRLFQGTSPKAAPLDRYDDEPDWEDWLVWNQPLPEDFIAEDCPLCHAVGACGYDDEGRALIHSLNVDEAAESAVEEAVRA